jgi:hypothetical protein
MVGWIPPHWAWESIRIEELQVTQMSICKFGTHCRVDILYNKIEHQDPTRPPHTYTCKPTVLMNTIINEGDRDKS